MPGSPALPRAFAVASLATLLCLSLAPAARAQGPQPSPLLVEPSPDDPRYRPAPSMDAFFGSGSRLVPGERPFRLLGGAFHPTNRATRERLADIGVSAGVAYDLFKFSGRGTPLVGGLYADLSDRKRGDQRLTTVGAGVQGRLYLTDSLSSTRPYLGAGVGGYSVRNDFGDGSDADSDFRIGGKLFAGFDSPSGFIGEVSFTAISRASRSTVPNGIQALVGVRF